MTTEAAFARAFLTALDSRPIKVQPDYAADLRTLEVPIPYTLPRMSEPMRPRSDATGNADGTTSDPSSSGTISIRLRSLRNPPLDLVLDSRNPGTTSILELKRAVANDLGLAGPEKVRILYRKKPCTDARTVKELINTGNDVDDDASKSATEVEFSVMIIGGVPERSTQAAAASPSPSPAPAASSTSPPPAAQAPAAQAPSTQAPAPAPAAPVALGPTGHETMRDPAFWHDLRGFLEQRVRDAEVAGEAVRVFEGAWKEKEKNR